MSLSLRGSTIFAATPNTAQGNTDDIRTNMLAANVCLVSASILHDLSDMQPQINAIKIEHPPYYCSSYTPPSAATTADHVQPAASFSEFQNLPLPLFLVDGVGVER